jgi:imidazolonepropionase-like amidohydrolase
LGEAGLRPEEVLLAATRTPAKMLHRAGELGAVLPGAAADLLIVEGDPLRDLSALRRRRWTVYGGVPLAANREGLASRDPLR